MQVGNAILSVKVIDDIAFEPVEVDEFKEYANITYDDADNIIDVIIIAARQQLEAATGKSFGLKTLEVRYSHNGERSMRLPYGPVIDMLALSCKSCYAKPYRDIIEDIDNWQLEGDRYSGYSGYYIAQYTAGYEELPEQLRTAIKAQALYLFENRGDSSKQAGITATALQLIQPYMSMV